MDIFNVDGQIFITVNYSFFYIVST